ncbi:hypothetical protein Droror1_Dr00022091 [Drosera rotundifolia]
MESQAEASSSLCSVPYLRPHTDKANKKQNHDMYFPVELITAILARLPVKTLLRFRSLFFVRTLKLLLQSHQLQQFGSLRFVYICSSTLVRHSMVSFLNAAVSN